MNSLQQQRQRGLQKYPHLIEQLDYETILAEHVREARAIDGWDAELESDPVMKLLEISAYRELTMRARINHAAISNLAQFTADDDLDAAAQWYQISRLPDEADERLRNRLFHHIRGMANNGTQDSYIARTMAADVRVKDVAAYRLAPGKVNVAVWVNTSVTDETVPAEDIAAVELHILEEVMTNVRREFSDKRDMLGIDVNVYSAKFYSVDVAATVYLSNHAPANAYEKLSEHLRDCAAAEATFGRSLSTSQIVAWLHESIGSADFVEKVVLTSPSEDLQPAHDELWKINTIDLEVIRE